MPRIAILILALSAYLPAWASTNCGLDRHLGETTKISVKSVYDGDTLTTQKGERIRLIGINTPELSDSEPLAEDAAKFLKKWQNQSLLLQLDKQKKDKYKRTLGHLFTLDGQNISALILKKGLGFLISIPPNLNYQDCYLASSRDAKTLNKGIYAHPYFAHASTQSQNLKSGFGRFIGQVESAYMSKRVIWLNFKGHISVKIHPKDLEHIDGRLYQKILTAHKKKSLSALGEIEFSGWLIDRMRFSKSMAKKIKSGKRKRFMLTLRHKNQWQIIP